MRNALKSVRTSSRSTLPVVRPSGSATRQARSGGLRGMMSSVSHAVFGLFSSHRTFYQAASRSKKLENVIESGPNGANGEIPVIRARSRYAKANFGFYRQMMRQSANNLVSYGITPIVPFDDLKELFGIWATESDARGRYDFYGQMWQIAEALTTDGEVIVRMRSRLDGDMLSGIPLQLQVMEADHLPIGYNQTLPNGNRVLDGVERDSIDRVVAYWLYRHHPQDFDVRQSSDFMPVRVPAEDIIHLYIEERVGSERGVPWAASTLNLNELRTGYHLNEAEKKEKQSRFTIFYERPLDEEGDGFGAEDADELSFVSPPTGAAVEVPEGYKTVFPDMPEGDPNFEAFQRFNLSEQAVSVGLFVEQITMDGKNLGNERILRALGKEQDRYVEAVQNHVLIHQFCHQVWRRLVSAAILAGKWTPPSDVPEHRYMRVPWMPPRRPHTHPVQEIQAHKEAIKAGLTSRSKVAAEMGYDVNEIDEENLRDWRKPSGQGLAYDVYTAAEITAAPAEGGMTMSKPLSEMLEEYGTAARAGVLTPQAEDEAAIRAALGLPIMSSKVTGLWSDTAYRKPVTIAVEGGEIDPETAAKLMSEGMGGEVAGTA